VTLLPFERRWAVAAMQAIFPGESDIGLADIRAMDVDGFLRESMAVLPWRAAFGVRLAVWLVAFAPLWVLYRFSTILRLSAADRERVVVALMSSEIYAVRSLALILKTLGALLYAGDDRVRTRLMHPPARVIRLRAKRARVV
jgi:hypothetical protein